MKSLVQITAGRFIRKVEAVCVGEIFSKENSPSLQAPTSFLAGASGAIGGW
jgi:hypothetical protein